uniref:Uncharacterized protein n=1 Tax=Callorhinchus milii TaxID=7868 RepID=A0A4W3GDN0_CALMI
MEEQRNGRSRPLEDQKLLYRRPAPGDQPEPQLFEMLDAKARQDCIKEIDLLKVSRRERGGGSTEL